MAKLAKHPERDVFWPQYVATLAAILAITSSSAGIAWSPLFYPYLTSDVSHIPHEDHDISFLVLINCFFAVVFAPIACYANDKFGRKPTMIAASLVGVVASVLLLFATNKWCIIISRALQGVQGSGEVIVGTYVSEMAHKDIRTRLLQLYSFSYSLGFLFLYTVALFLDFHQVAVVLIVVPLFAMILTVWIPESPYFHAMKCNYTKTKTALKRLGYTHITDEIATIKATLTTQNNGIGFVNFFEDRGICRAFATAIFLCGVWNLSGLAPITVYTQSILDAKCHPYLTPGVSILILQVVSTTSQVSGIFLANWFRAKTIYFTSTLLSGVFVVALALNFFFKDFVYAHFSGAACVPFGLMAVFYVAAAPGIVGLGWAMIQCFFPVQYKRVAMSMLMFFSNVFAFLSLFIFEVFRNHVTISWGFMFFGGFTVLNAALVMPFVPETANKEFKEIYDWFGIDLKKGEANQLNNEASEKVLV